MRPRHISPMAANSNFFGLNHTLQRSLSGTYAQTGIRIADNQTSVISEEHHSNDAESISSLSLASYVRNQVNE